MFLQKLAGTNYLWNFQVLNDLNSIFYFVIRNKINGQNIIFCQTTSSFNYYYN